jgi:hypothetical protein
LSLLPQMRAISERNGDLPPPRSLIKLVGSRQAAAEPALCW